MNAIILYGMVPLASYLIGGIPFAWLIGRLKGVDIRKEGSGNVGATNVTRVIGRFWGRVCFFLDFFKGAFPVFATMFLAERYFLDDAGPDSSFSPFFVLPVLAAIGAVFGHIWPVYLKFRGGRGISTALGALILFQPAIVLLSCIIWLIVFFTTRYVSIASILMAVSLPVMACLLASLDSVFLFQPGDVLFYLFPFPSLPQQMLFALIALLTIWKHKDNLARLRAGTESKFGQKKDEAGNEAQNA